MEEDPDPIVYSKKYIAQEIAQRQGFTISDVTIILDELVQVIKDIIASGDILKWSGLFKMTIGKIRPYKGWDNFGKKEVDIPGKKRIIFTPSIVLTRLVNEEWDFEEDDEEEAEEYEEE